MKVTRPRPLAVFTLVATLTSLFLLVWTGSANPTHAPAVPMSNTAITEAQASVEIPPPEPRPPLLDVIATGILDDASPIEGGDCDGAVQSAAYDLPGGRWLYAYELENRCVPTWDVGYVAAGGGLRVPLNGNLPIPSTLGPDSWHTTNESFQPYTQDFVNFNAGNVFRTFAGDFTVAAERSAADLEFFNADGILRSSDIAGFITTSPPQVQNGVFLGGSTAAFDLVTPQPAQACPPEDDDDCPDEDGDDDDDEDDEDEDGDDDEDDEDDDDDGDDD
jgi:hypothetical protein